MYKQKKLEYWLVLWFLPFEEVPEEFDEMNEESQLEVALQASIQLNEPRNHGLEPPVSKKRVVLLLKELLRIMKVGLKFLMNQSCWKKREC